MVFFSRKSLKSKRGGEIYPDEIFLDSSNLPDFDTQQFEGRIEKPISKKAIFSLGFFFVCILFIFSFKLFILQIKEGNQYLIRGEDNRLEHSVIFSERGIVYDKKDVELIWNTFDEEEPYAIRNYIEKDGLAHLLGYVSYPLEDSSGNFYQIETIGKDGVENYFNSKIKGENGLKIIEVDALQNIKSESVIKPPKNGENITLTIDSELQSHLYSFIKNLSKDVGFKGGAGVIMNIKNGEILAMSSYPEYNSNILSNSGDKNEIANYIGNKNNPFLNRVTSGLYTPGSIVKPFMALGALTEGVITPDKQILSTGSISLPNPYYPELKSVFKDWKAHGWVDMRRALAVSSDVYFYEIGGGYKNEQQGIGISNIEKYTRMFGIGELTGVPLLGEAQGVIPNPEWKAKNFDGEPGRLGNTYHTAIGQYGFQTTPLQMARAVAALANGGTLVTPQIMAGAPGEGGTPPGHAPKI